MSGRRRTGVIVCAVTASTITQASTTSTTTMTMMTTTTTTINGHAVTVATPGATTPTAATMMRHAESAHAPHDTRAGAQAPMVGAVDTTPMMTRSQRCRRT